MKICDMEIKVNGNKYLALVTSYESEKEQITELEATDLEDLLTEVNKYLLDCYDK
jgi:glucokinase